MLLFTIFTKWGKNIMVKLLEMDDYILTNLTLIFLLINFNLEIGIIYGVMAIVDWISYNLAVFSNIFKPIPIENDNGSKRFFKVGQAVVIYIIFIFIANFITTRFMVAPQASAIDNISKLMSTTFSATPILAGAKFLRLVVWGVLIAIIETRSFFRTWLQWGLNAAKIKFPSDIFSWTTSLIIVFFAGAFTIFHIMAKGIQNNEALMVTFIFGSISIGAIIYFKEVIQAIFFHIITNVLATMSELKIGFFETGTAQLNASGLVMVSGLIIIAFVLLFGELPIPKRFII